MKLHEALVDIKREQPEMNDDLDFYDESNQDEFSDDPDADIAFPDELEDEVSEDELPESDEDLEFPEDESNPEDEDLDDFGDLGGFGGSEGSPEGDGEFGEPESDEPADDVEELDSVVDKAAEDPDRQGLIRTVKGAHMVYKRQSEDGTYEELWMYQGKGALKDELSIRKAILSGTDIPSTKRSSQDGKQNYVIWSAGNSELLKIVGLPN